MAATIFTRVCQAWFSLFTHTTIFIEKEKHISDIFPQVTQMNPRAGIKKTVDSWIPRCLYRKYPQKFGQSTKQKIEKKMITPAKEDEIGF